MLHAMFQDHRTSGFGEDFFTIYRRGNHLGHVTWTIYINFRPPPLPKEAPQEIWHQLAGQLVSEKKAFENNGHKHVYSPGAGADNSLGSNLFQQRNSSVNLVICCKFYPLRRSASNNWQILTSCLYLVE